MNDYTPARSDGCQKQSTTVIYKKADLYDFNYYCDRHARDEDPADDHIREPAHIEQPIGWVNPQCCRCGPEAGDGEPVPAAKEQA